jgi:hypothetical protein
LSTPTIFQHTLTVELPLACEHGNATATVQTIVGMSRAGIAEPQVEHSNLEIQNSGPSISDAVTRPTADTHNDQAGQIMAQQFDLLIAGGAANQPKGLAAEASHSTPSEGAAVIGLDHDGFDSGAHAMNGAAPGVDPPAFGGHASLADGAPAVDTKSRQDLLQAFSPLASGVQTLDISSDWMVVLDRIAVNKPASTNSDSSDSNPVWQAGPNLLSRDAQTILSSDKSPGDDDAHPNQITTWKRSRRTELPTLSALVNGAAQPAIDVKSLHAKSGELTLETIL